MHEASVNGVILIQITSSNSTSGANLKGGNYYTKTDESIRGGVKVVKRDTDSLETVAQGDATLEGAVFEIVNDNDFDVEVNGVSYGPNETVYTMVTDENGFATTAEIDSNGNVADTDYTLPFGNYRVVEVQAPTGYLNQGVIDVPFSIEKDGVVVDITDATHSIINIPERGGVMIAKWDDELVDYDENLADNPQGGATLEGAVLFQKCNKVAF